jgi:hypothetical protein
MTPFVEGPRVESPIVGARGSSEAVLLEVDSDRWLTPGAYISRAIAHRPEVRYVLERLEQSRLAVFVILESDPEEILDAIFDAERELYSTFRGLPFDVRVRTPSPDWDPRDLLRETVLHHQRIDADVRRG